MQKPDLAKLDALPPDKQAAFLALFAGAVHDVFVLIGPDGTKFPPHFGKYECERVAGWEDFYMRELPALGWIEVTESERKAALGAAPGSTCYHMEIVITRDGRNVREAYWSRLKSARCPEKS
jgi:hypothetical protein